LIWLYHCCCAFEPNEVVSESNQIVFDSNQIVVASNGHQIKSKGFSNFWKSQFDLTALGITSTVSVAFPNKLDV
jgi:hypothetical protein